jgi:cysteine desulfurase/selenocysteine lyase
MTITTVERKPTARSGVSDVADIRNQFPIFTKRKLHYLDSAATAQMPKVVADAIEAFDLGMRANVYGGVYGLACEALSAYEHARIDIARFLGANTASEVVFTYGTTSAINLVAASFGESLGPDDEIIISALEHHSNTLPWRALASRRGVKLKVLPVTPEGQLDLAALPGLLTSRCRLIAVTHCSNVTGALTEVSTVVSAAKSVGAAVLLDGAQRAPHGPLDVARLGIDFYAFSGHKTFGPTGIGVLWGRKQLLDTMPPFMVGGQMIRRVTAETAEFADPPRRFEAGTPAIGAAIGLGAAMRWMETLDWPAVGERELRLTRRVLDALECLPEAKIVGPRTTDGRIGVISFAIAGMTSEEVCRAMDRGNVALRHGHHCAQPLMLALGVEGTARVSLAPYVSDEDIDAFIAGLDELTRRRLV